MTSTATIRAATMADLPQILDLLLLIREETFWAAVTPDLSQMEAWLLQQGCENPHFLLLVAEEGGELVGLLGAHLTGHGLAPGVLFLAEWAWYVRPAERGKGTATAMWRQARAWAKTQGAVGSVSATWRYWGHTWEV
jgi:L-amino acid N-acyltransferase YncA